MMRSALDAVSDKFRNFNTSLRTAVPGSIPLETVQGTDHPLAEPQPPSVPYDDPQPQPQPRPRINGISSKGQGQGVRTSVESQRDGADGNVSGRASLDSEWCDLGPSTGSSRHGRGQVFNKRLLHFQAELLAGGSIDMANVRALAFDGVPDRDGLRAIIWKLLLGYQSRHVPSWAADLSRKREEYAQFCKDLIVDPNQFGQHQSAEPSSQEGIEPLEGHPGTQDDHPLSTDGKSRWKEYFKDAEMLEQIERDVLRTHPDMHFFSGDDSQAVLHREEMTRVLFIFAKLNRGLTYVQGMNELLAPLYHLLSTDKDRAAAQHAEADSFFCFVALISEFRDNFCQQLDNSSVGIRATISSLNQLLKVHDRQLWHHLEVKNKVNPQFYAFRWITLLLTQEFSCPDVVRLWDSMLSDPAGRSDCLQRICVAMLLNLRDELLQGDFAHNLKLLQRYPPVDVQTILVRAAHLRIITDEGGWDL